jgi:hypothetical protein
MRGAGMQCVPAPCFNYGVTMKNKTVVSVSEITGSILPDQSLCYGFTVLYEDGEIHNEMRQTDQKNQADILQSLTALQLQYKNLILL